MMPSTPCDPWDLGPLGAEATVDAIMTFWRGACERGQLNTTQPVDVLDLLPGRGSAVRMTLRLLLERASSLDFNLTLRYVACFASDAQAERFRQHPDLRRWIETGVLVTAMWDAPHDPPFMARPGGRVRWRPHNPVVVLAHDAWRRMPQRLIAVHYGELLEADPERLVADRAGAASDVWRPASVAGCASSVTRAFERYLATLNSTPVSVPTGALAVLQRIAEVATAGYLVVAAAPGAASTRRLRGQAFGDVCDAIAKTGCLPVNFHLLGEWLREIGACVWQLDTAVGLATQVALGGPPATADMLAACVAPFASGAFADGESLSHAMHAVAMQGHLPAILTLLRQSRFDPRVFAAAGTPRCRTGLSSGGCDRAAWADALRRVWANHLPVTRRDGVVTHLVESAMCIADWGLARSILRRVTQDLGDDADRLALWARCDLETGQLESAAMLAARAVELRPDHPAAASVRGTLCEKRSAWDARWRRPIVHPGRLVVLEPLDVGHAAAFLHQYRDPQIAAMIGMPPLASLRDAQELIRTRTAEEGQHEYAVMHADFGFVGNVSLNISAATACLCFWTGSDHQGGGFATEAGRLLCRFAFRQQVDVVIAMAYEDNVRSIRALQRIGFESLPVRPADREDRRVFLALHRGDAKAEDPIAALIAYLERTQAAIELVRTEGRRLAPQE
jgi:RimJ/RimL family protein N-acetyltransferase